MDEGSLARLAPSGDKAQHEAVADTGNDGGGRNAILRGVDPGGEGPGRGE